MIQCYPFTLVRLSIFGNNSKLSLVFTAASLEESLAVRTNCLVAIWTSIDLAARRTGSRLTCRTCEGTILAGYFVAFLTDGAVVSACLTEKFDAGIAKQNITMAATFPASFSASDFAN